MKLATSLTYSEIRLAGPSVQDTTWEIQDLFRQIQDKLFD